MKKIIILFAFALFTITAGAQETKATKAACCANKEASAKTMTADEIAKCQAKCKSEGKVCTANEKVTCKKDEKKCCAKKA